jgi:photosystem II stability/assembly factor-like uncharacterized protein
VVRRIGVSVLLAALAWSGFPSAFGALADTSTPGPPVNVSAQTGTLSALVQWTPTGSLATSYTIRSNPRGITATVDGASTSATVTGLAFATSYTFTVAGTNSSGTGQSSAASNAITPIAPGGPYHEGAPRVLFNSDLTAGQPQNFNIGQDRVHAPGLTAVVLNVTASQAPAAAGVQVVVKEQVVQTVSVGPGEVESSLVVVAVAQQMNPAALQVTAGRAHVEIDFVGFFTDERTVRDQSGLLQMIRTSTVLDATVGAGSATDIPMLGQGDVPQAGVAGVLINVTAINPAGAGSVSLLAQGTVDPGTTTLGFAAGQTTANREIVPLPANGIITLLDRGATTEVRIDVLGWFSDGTDPEAVGALYTPVTPTREVDTAAQGGPVPAGGSVTFPVWGQAGAPDGSAPGPTTSALVEITVTSPAGAGSIVISGASMIDFGAGQTVAGTAAVQVAMPAGSASFTVIGAATNVTVDLVAYFSGDLIMPGSTKVLTPAQLAGITNLGANSITFAPGVQVSPPVRLNDVINAGSSAATPSGLLRRVQSISTGADGSTIFGTRTASIPEALTTFFLDWTLPRSAATFGASQGGPTRTIASAAPRNANILPPPPGTSIDPSWPTSAIARPPQGLLLDLSTDNPGLKSGSEIDVNDFEAQARMNLVTNLGRGGKFTMQVAFGVGLRASIDIQLLGQVNLLDRKNLLDTFFPVGPPIFIWIGFFIFEFQPGIDASLEFKVSLAAGAVFHLGLDRYIEISGGYDGKNFFVDPITNKDYLTAKQEFNWRPSIQVDFELDLHIDPAIAFYGGVAKIQGDPVAFARFTVDPTAPHWWDVTLGICRAFEFRLNLIFLTQDFTSPPVCLTLTALEAPGRILPITITPSPASVARSGTQHFHASIPLSVDGVSWAVQEPGGGTLSNVTQFDADYTAPAQAGTYHLQVAALDDPTSTGQVEITVTPIAPGSPTNVTASLSGSTSATVSWIAPADDGGTPLIGYTVTASPGGATVQTNQASSSAIIANLAPATTYTFTVVATNKGLLNSSPSAPSNSITTPPAGPMSVAPTALDFGTVTLGQSSAAQTVVVTPDGVPLAISSVALSGTSAGEFAIQSDSCSGQTVQPGNTCSFDVLYIPTAQVAASGVVTITDSDSTSPQTVALVGSSPVQATSGLFAVGDIHMTDSQVGYVVDAGSFNRSSVMKTTDGGKTWIRLPTPTNVVIDANDINIQFLDADHGFVFACLPSSSGACFTPLLISTSDGGQTWKQLSTIPDHLGAKSMWFTDSMHGWITGGLAGPTPPSDYFGGSGLTGLYATTDGGLTWTKETLPDPILATPNCIPLSFNTGVKFVDSLHGWVAGTSYCNSTIAPHGGIAQGGLVWTTSDGGATWTVHALPSNVITLSDRELAVLGVAQMRTVALLQDTPFVSHNYLMSTNDGGGTFSFNLAPQISPADLVFTDPTHGLLLGNDGSVWRTGDEGATWSDVGTLPKFLSSAGKIQTYTYTRMSTDGTNAWVVGFVLFGPSNFSLLTAGFIEHSADGGATWTVQLLGNGT